MINPQSQVNETQPIAASRYALPSRLLHWLSALAFLGLFALGVWMVELDYYHGWYKTGPAVHKAIGIVLLFATVLRLALLAYYGKPASTGKPLVLIMTKLGHLALYLGLFGLFITGYLISTADGRGINVFDWFNVPSVGELFAQQEDIAGTVHQYLAYTLVALAVGHALMALKHHFLDKDNTLTKML